MAHGQLFRHVRTTKGTTYVHTCEESTFKEVCHLVDEQADRPFVYLDLVRLSGLPSTQVATAVAFLKEHGLIVSTSRRRLLGASEDVFLGGMGEWAALEEGIPREWCRESRTAQGTGRNSG